MMIDSDDDDALATLPLAKFKKRNIVNIPDLATGPEDFMQALTESGFHPRSGTLPNLLSISY